MRLRRHRIRRKVAALRSAAPHCRPRHRPDVPEPGAVRHHDGARQRDDRPPLPHTQRLRIQRSAAAARGARGERGDRQGWSARRFPWPQGGCGYKSIGSARRQAETGRAGGGPRGCPDAAGARRAGERPEPRGSRRSGRGDPRHPRPPRSDHPAGRAPHEPGDEHLRSGGGARLRAQDRGGHARRGACLPGSDSCLPGERTLMALLEAKGLRASYGPTRVLHGIDFAIDEGSITALLGANGAGKTTILRALCGMVKTEGDVRFGGARIDGRLTEDIVRLGIAHVPDGRGTFVNLTTEENLRLGAYTRKDRAAVESDLERIFTYFPRLKERLRQPAGTLPGGEQQMLAVSRALMLRPKLLLPDEPSFGLAPLLVRELFEIMRTVNQRERVSILLVEQNAAMALDLANRAYLIETGRVVLSGAADEIKRDDAVRRSYLGY